MKTNEGTCPKCKDVNLDYGPLELDHGEIRFPYACKSCYFEGIEIYALNFLGHMKQSYEQDEIIDFI